jgi:hypothetical protein
MALRKLRSDFQQFTEDLHIQVLNGMFSQREQALKDLLSLATYIHKQFVTRYQKEEIEVRLKWIEEQASEVSVFVTSQKMSAYFSDLRHRLQIMGQSFDSTHQYVQQERCFVVTPTDSLYHRELKRAKRSARYIESTWYQTINAIGKIWSRTPENAPEWVHHVNWSVITRIAGNQVGIRLLEAIRSDLELRNELSACLVAISDAGLNEINRSEHLHAAAERLYEYIARINEHIKSVRDDVNQALLGDLDNLYLKLVYADTVNASAELDDEIKIDKDADELRVVYASQLRAWDTDSNTVLSQLGIDIGFQRFLLLIESESQEVVELTLNSFRLQLKPTLQQVFERLEQTADDFQLIKKDKKESRAVFLKRVQQVTQELRTYLQEDFLNVLSKVIDNTDIGTRFEEAFAEIVLNNRLLTAETQVFSSSGGSQDSNHKPRTDTEKVDFRREITVYLNHELFRKMRLVHGKLTPLLDSMQKLAMDITQIVDVNMQVADELATSSRQSDITIQELYDLIHDGLDRAAARSNDLTQQVDRFIEQVTNHSLEPVTVFRQLCERIMRQDDYLYIRTRNREVKATSRAIDWKQRLIRNWNGLSDSAEAWGRLGLQIGRRQLNTFRNLLGFQTGDETGRIIKSEASQFLASTDKSLKQLPLIYRRLFTSEPLQELRFYKGRQTMQRVFETAYSSWQSGTASNLVIIGEKGSGKTSVVNVLHKEVEGSTIKVFRGSIDFTTYDVESLLSQLCDILGMKPVKDPAVFIENVNTTRNRRMVFLEGFQNVYLRNMHGFDALEAFLLILTQTGSHVFWVVSGSRYAWQYLDKIYDLDGYFTHKRFVDEVDIDRLKDIVLSRHTVSGYELEFLPSSTMKDSRAYRKASADETVQQQLLRDAYFEKLHDFSKGNIAIALQYWQLSVKEIVDDVIIMRPLEDLRLALGNGFSNDDLFALGAIVLHDDLTEEQMANALHIDYTESRMILAKLTARSVLYRHDNRYFLNNLLYRPVVDLLKSKNIIH